MLLRFRVALLGFASLSLASCGGGGSSPGPSATATPAPTPTPTVAPTPTPTATPSPITITDSGSTNRKAFTIVVNFNDSATVTQDGTMRNATVTASETTQFFSDVIANAPMSNVATNNGCTKSASYGSTTMLTYNGSTSQDISCPPTTTSPAQTLYTDVQNIETQIGPFNN